MIHKSVSLACLAMSPSDKLDPAGLHLLPPQREVLMAGILNSGFNCILQMPTGSGKTWLAEHAIAQVLSAGSRTVYITPLQALATELIDH